MRLILNNFSLNDGPFLFIASFWNSPAEVGGSGFFCVSSNYSVLLAGACPIHATSDAETDLLVINLALQALVDTGFLIKNFFITSPASCKSISLDHAFDRRLQPWIFSINLLLHIAGRPCMHSIPKS